VLKLPPIKINHKVVLVGILSVLSIAVPQYAAYLGAVRATIEQNQTYNAQLPAIEIGQGGCSHIQKIKE